jgi:hypothetical protein
MQAKIVSALSHMIEIAFFFCAAGALAMGLLAVK